MATYPISIDSAGGEYMEAVLILGWEVRPGDPVKAGQLVVTVETAKAATEIEAGHDGWLTEIFFEKGQEAPVGAVLGTISDAKPSAQPAAQASAAATASAAAAVSVAARPAAPRVVATPLARRIAKEAGLDLTGLSGTGPNGRIKQRDVQAALDARKSAPAASVLPRPLAAPAAVPPRTQAAPLVLLHGFGADRSAWRQVTALLPPDIETITLDLPGHGGEAERPAFSIEDIAFSLSDRLEAAGVERAHIAGHSLGGAAALALSALGRVALRSVTLLAPGGLGPEINGGFIGGLTRSPAPEALERWLSLMTGPDYALPQGYAQAAFRQMEKTGNRDVLAAMAERLFPGGTQAFDLSAALKSLTVPARILWGRADRVIPPAHAGHAPGFAALHLLEGVGHVPHMENPALTARLLTESVRSAS